MFYSCKALTQAPALQATTLAYGCYSSMLANCTSLASAPELPATTLETNCYYSMFYGCESLTQAPVLPATTLVSRCYYGMFEYCKKLNYVKAMFTDISAEYCLAGWLTNVSQTGRCIKNSAATWTNTDAEIPANWTVQTV